MFRIIITAIALCLTMTSMSAQTKKKTTTKKTVPVVNYQAEAIRLIDSYEFDHAIDIIDDWEAALDKSKHDYPPQLETLRSRAVFGKNLLERVEKIDLVDVLEIDSVGFVNAYRLSHDAGELFSAEILPDEYASQSVSMVFVPQDGKHLFWSMPVDSVGRKIVYSNVLDDGTITDPVDIGDAINNMVRPDYPFVVDDGSTVYFSAMGDESLGGYDIFMTRMSADGEILQPQNIGMPFNSPYNDYMMVVDDARNLGWWVSDRNHIPGKLSLYVFRPSAMRVNHDPDESNIADLAKLNGVPVAGGLDDLLTDSIGSNDNDDEFVFSLGNGRVYTRMSQFRSSQARVLMNDMLLRQYELDQQLAELDGLRTDYARGNKSVAQRINSLEKQVASNREQIDRMTNRIISIELR